MGGGGAAYCASMHAEPEPVDLSGETKRFVVDHDNRVAIRAMTRGDLDDVVALALERRGPALVVRRTS